MRSPSQISQCLVQMKCSINSNYCITVAVFLHILNIAFGTYKQALSPDFPGGQWLRLHVPSTAAQDSIPGGEMDPDATTKSLYATTKSYLPQQRWEIPRVATKTSIAK